MKFLGCVLGRNPFTRPSKRKNPVLNLDKQIGKAASCGSQSNMHNFELNYDLAYGCLQVWMDRAGGALIFWCCPDAGMLKNYNFYKL